jgi:hypothetical protein
MSTKLAVPLLVGALSLATPVVALEAPSDSGLEEGVRQAQLGEFEKAVVTLDGAARRLAAEGGRSRELARAYVYLSIAYLGLSQEQKARAQFLEALKADTEIQLDRAEFPPKILEFFESARKEAVAEGVVAPVPAAPAPPPAAATPAEPAPVAEAAAPVAAPEKKGGGSKTLLLVGGGAAAAAGIALAAGGGGGGGGTAAPTPTPQPVEETIELFSAEVPRPIPDLSQAFSQLTFGPSGTIVQAFLEFRIRHSCRGDLWLELRHPDGSTFTAEAPGDCEGLWEGPLGVPAEGKGSNGTWSLTVMDRFEGDEGVLETWGVRLRIRR